MNHQRRKHAFTHDAIGNAAENRARDTASAVSGDGDDVSIIRLRKANDGIRNIIGNHDRRSDSHMVTGKTDSHSGEIRLGLLDIAGARGSDRGLELSCAKTPRDRYDAEQSQLGVLELRKSESSRASFLRPMRNRRAAR
jgi:hypothetical protein